MMASTKRCQPGCPPPVCQNLAESVKFLAFYDIKNARLMERRPGETLVQQETLFDMAMFAAFCEVTTDVLKPGQDFVWMTWLIQLCWWPTQLLGWLIHSCHVVTTPGPCDEDVGHANSRTYHKAIFAGRGNF